MKIFLARSFVKSYKKATKNNPRLALKIKDKIDLFKTNPNHPSLRLHKLEGTKYADWSISVDRDLRILLTYTKDGAILVLIGTHKEVY